jgi:hypothetical protein
MRVIFMLALLLLTWDDTAQPKRVTEKVAGSGQKSLELEFTFVQDITIKTWDKNEVLMEVDVTINNAEHNDIFSLKTTTTATGITIAIDKDMWKQIEKTWKGKDGCCNCHTSEINYTMYAPKSMSITANAISGNYQFTYSGQSVNPENHIRGN